MLIRNFAHRAGPLLCLLTFSSALVFTGVRAEPSATPAAAKQACRPVPTLALSPGFQDSRGAFSPDSKAFRSVERRFAAAYGMACRKGALAVPLMRTGASDPSRLFLKNAPSANTVSIYQDGGEGAGGPMVLEFPFIGEDGRSHLPKVEELRSAIVCSNYYASPPAGDVLECLVD